MHVRIFSTPTCPYCNMAKKFFKEKGVAFDEIDVSKNEEARREMMQKSGQSGVPVIIVEKDSKEEVIIGYDLGKLNGVV